MSAVYKVSSSAKVKQMEAELWSHLSALKVEIEENGGAGSSNAYSSVLPPKDISFFRVEREHALRRGLQVADVLPTRSQADIMQRELESCLSLEYTPDSLPLLLHQFFTDRSYQLAQIRYLLMLRWRRFCRHASVIEKLYPHYKDQMSYITREYQDAVQRARRLSASREKMLTGRGNPVSLLTQDDVVIYLQWLVCHLHSVQPIHNFLRVLHYVPMCERKDEAPGQEILHETQQADRLPLHTVHLEQFMPELESLLAYFHLPYDTGNLKTTADEMELFSMVWREFKAIFRQQEQMKTFPPYDGTDVRESQWGRKSANMAVCKEANWIPFIQVKPRRDPWQQKLFTKLKEKNSVNELLQMQCKFLQVRDLLHVAAALKEHAAQVGNSQSTSFISSSRKTKKQMISEIWKSVYNAANLIQSLEDNLQILGLDDSLPEGSSGPVVTRGAYLSLIYLRHLKLRELQRVSLGMLNYLRSVERTLTFDLAGLQLEGQVLHSTAEETGWMNAARGGKGEAEGLGSFQYIHNTPVDCKVHCSEFMEFAEVENLHDFYTSEGSYIHTQDHRGFYIMYDAALQDLAELMNELLLIGSHFIHRNTIKLIGKTEGVSASTVDFNSWAGTDVDRVAVLLNLWTCETEFIESKVQLLNCYYEAYQHAAGTEERFALAQVITDIMHRKPQLDLNQDYFFQAYRTEISCMQSHQRLIRDILDNQIERQRLYLQRIWRNDHKAFITSYGRPPNYVPQYLVSLGGGRHVKTAVEELYTIKHDYFLLLTLMPALMNVFLLEVHPSLCLASAVYQGLVQAHTELCQLHRVTSISDKLHLEHNLLEQALKIWNNQTSPGASYSSQIQRDLFSDVFIEDPLLVQKLGLSLVKAAEERDMKQGPDKHLCAVETLSMLLELMSIRHRLLESASETAHLAQLYRNVALELGFEEFHLYLRPLQFECTDQKVRVQQRPVFITEILEDDSSVDRFIPSHLPLSIQELDENQIGRFSFSSEEAVIHLMNRQSIENLQVALACQVTQKNALMSAVKLAQLCLWAESDSSSAEVCVAHWVMGAFVSIQLEKVGLRDEMLNSFVKKKQAVGGFLKTPEEAAEIKRELIIDFLRKFSTQMSLHCVRAQIVGYYHNLTFLLEDIPYIRQSYFMIGQPVADRCSDPRIFQQLLCADGRTLLNLWYIPHFTEVLRMFKTLDVSACDEALRHTLQIVSALHDIIHYLISFSKLGNRQDSLRWGRGHDAAGSHLAADWGGAESIGTELQELQQQVDHLSDPSSLESVGRLLQLRRQVLLLQFDTAVRIFVREAFLSSGDFTSYQSVSDNMANALPLMIGCIQTDVFSLTLPVPRPLENQGCQVAQRMYPWRSFIACHGLLPLHGWDVPPTEYCMQLCLSSLSSRSRLQANAAILGVSLLMEDVLNGGREAEPVRLHGNKDDLQHSGTPNEGNKSCREDDDEEEETKIDSSDLQDPIRVQSVLKGFLLLTKQLEVFKESWALRRLGVDVFRTPALYQQFVKLYRDEIFYPSMRALAKQMDKEHHYEVFISGTQSLLPPPGASEVDVKAWQLHLLMESTECDMIRAVQRKTSRELTLVLSEKTQQDNRLPTKLWKRSQMKYSLSPEQPQMVETFIQQLMQGAEQSEGELKVSRDHLQQCLTHLSSSVMERERQCFLLYSQFYEQILQQHTQLLYQREQDLKSLKDAQTSNSHKEVADLCRGMMLEVSALRAQVAHLEEEKINLEEQLGLRFKERYHPLVRHLFSTCIQLKARLDEYPRQMERDVSVMVNRARGEGVDKIIKLKKRYGCTKDDDGLTLTQLKKDEVHELKLENSRLTALLCKLKALRRWRQVVDQEKLHRQLLQTKQREVTTRTEALRVKMLSEEKVALLQEELDFAQQALTCSQAECSSIKKQLSRKTEEFQVFRHRSAREAHSRQELDAHRVQTLEQMRADMEDRDRQLRAFGEQLDRGSRINRLQRERSAKEIRQVRGQLQQQRSLKQEAFQQLDKLQNQVNDVEAALSRGASTAGLHRNRQHSALQLGSLTNYTTPQDFATEPRQQRAETARGHSNTSTDRPKADLCRLRAPTAEALFPDL
ncbi:granzyme K [Sarotherodon galilaeus]